MDPATEEHRRPRTDRQSAGPSVLRSRDERTLVVLILATTLLLEFCFHSQRVPLENGIAPRTGGPARILINHCDWPELCLLHGIGRTRAQRIVAERQRNGPFHSVAELARVDGIGQRTCERLADQLDFSCKTSNLNVGDTQGTCRLE